MTQHAAQSAPRRSVLSANAPPQAPRPAPDEDSKLVDGVAAQDALVALFDEFAEEKPPRMRRSILRLFRHNDAPAEGMVRGRK
jgi:hypothetical protein